MLRRWLNVEQDGGLVIGSSEQQAAHQENAVSYYQANEFLQLHYNTEIHCAQLVLYVADTCFNNAQANGEVGPTMAPKYHIRSICSSIGKCAGVLLVKLQLWMRH